jgi:hypothetical protein
MNETVYLFALSVPDLLEVLVADQARSTTDTRPLEPASLGRAPRAEDRPT